MAEIHILFSRAAPITWYQRNIYDSSLWLARYAHCEFSHGDYIIHAGPMSGALLGASDNPDAPVVIHKGARMGNPRGVAVREPTYQRFAVRRKATIPTTPDHVKKYEAFLMDQLGKPFDTDALKFSTFLSSNFNSRNWRDDSKWYCHEMLVHGYEVARVLAWKLVNAKNRITGGDHLLIINPLIDVDAFRHQIPDIELSEGEV
jgi:hypothetical protein